MSDPNKVIELSDDEKASVVEKKVTCPFLGPAIAEGRLLVRNDANDPLASIEDVRELGNTGGGHLGDVLVLFAKGNHLSRRGASGKLDERVPDDLFSLELPGSQGSHPGHSGILQGDSQTLDSGRLSEADFARLIGRAKDGWIKRSDVGRFIAENVLRDPKAKVFGIDTASVFGHDFLELGETIISTAAGLFGSAADATHRDIKQKFTKLTGEDNLVGSAGEFGLLFAFLVNKPGAKEVEGEPAVAVEDLRTMFVDKRLPDGWDTWKKSRQDWVTNTHGLVQSARAEYKRLKGA
jgi:hypothetical protein